MQELQTQGSTNESLESEQKAGFFEFGKKKPNVEGGCFSRTNSTYESLVVVRSSKFTTNKRECLCVAVFVVVPNE